MALCGVAHTASSVTSPTTRPGLGPEPDAGAERSAWRQAQRVADDRERDVGIDR